MTRWCIYILAWLGLLCMAACGQSDDAEKPTATPVSTSTREAATQPARIVEITLSFVTPRFRPDPVVIEVGKPVQFKVSSADTRHNFTIEALGINVDVPQKALDQSVTTAVVTPRDVGTFRMLCSVHKRLRMEGTLEVKAAPARP